MILLDDINLQMRRLKMNMTKNWVTKQIKDYESLINGLDENEVGELLNKRLKEIWQTNLNTLKATLKVINLEIQTL